jgi:hypothetical protein
MLFKWMKLSSGVIFLFPPRRVTNPFQFRENLKDTNKITLLYEHASW